MIKNTFDRNLALFLYNGITLKSLKHIDIRWNKSILNGTYVTLHNHQRGMILGGEKQQCIIIFSLNVKT